MLGLRSDEHTRHIAWTKGQNAHIPKDWSSRVHSNTIGLRAQYLYRKCAHKFCAFRENAQLLNVDASEGMQF